MNVPALPQTKGGSNMMQDDFDPTDFRGLTLAEQISKCNAKAAEAESFAAVNAENRDAYLALAAKWSLLAEEMGHALHSRESEA